jgi:nicotinamidase-related amidase
VTVSKGFVDMQIGLFDAEDKPFEGERILDNINALIRSARVAGVPVLAARHTGPIGSPLAPDSPATRLLDRLEIDPERDRVSPRAALTASLVRR